MAIKPRALVSNSDRGDYKKYFVEESHVRVVAADPAITMTGTLVEDAVLPERGDIWPKLTPMFYDDVVKFWKVWTNGRAIESFLLGATGDSDNLFADNRTGRLQMFTGFEVQALMMYKGYVHSDDVYLPPGETLTNLHAALSNTLREDNIHVYGLVSPH